MERSRGGYDFAQKSSQSESITAIDFRGLRMCLYKASSTEAGENIFGFSFLRIKINGLVESDSVMKLRF